MLLLSTLAFLIACAGKEEDSGAPLDDSSAVETDENQEAPSDIEADSRCSLPADDPCMTEELYADCLELAASCEGNILTLDSCPYGGFSCEE